jgi:hypothetical protein
MSIESDADKDLALNDEDAEEVIGGKANRKKSTKHTASAAVALDPLVVRQIDTGPGELPGSSSPPEFVDPGASS